MFPRGVQLLFNLLQSAFWRLLNDRIINSAAQGKTLEMFTVSLSSFHMSFLCYDCFVCEWAVRKGPSESVNIRAAGASHSESIPQSVCVALTQCSLWTLSTVLFLSSQITAFQMGSPLWYGEQASTRGQRGPKKQFGKRTGLEHVSAAECKDQVRTNSTTRMHAETRMT